MNNDILKEANFSSLWRKNNPYPIYTYRFKQEYYPNGRLMIPLHWHEKIEIMQPNNDTILTFNGKTFKINSDELVLIPANSLHEAKSELGEKTFFSFLFSPSFFLSNQSTSVTMKMIYHFVNSSAPLIIKLKQLPRACEYLQKIYTEAKNAPDCFYSEDPASLGMAFCIFYDIYCCADINLKNDNFAKNLAVVQKALTFIQENFLSPITLDQIADHVSFSKFYFLNLFKKITQKTPLKFCVELRLNHAYSLLLNGKSVTEAAFDSGFSNISYFTRAFKEYYGTTPKHVIVKN